MKVKINRTFFMEFLISLIIWIKLFEHLSIYVLYRFASLGIVLGVILFLFYILTFRLKLNVCVFCGIVVLIGILNAFFIGQTSMGNLSVLLLTYFPVVLVFTSLDRLHLKFWYFTCSLLAVFIMYRYFNSPDMKVFYNQSENFVSVYLTIFLFFLALALDKEGKKIPFSIVILYYFCCLAGRGRGGILSASFYIISIYIHRLMHNDSKRSNNIVKKFVSIVIVSIFVLFCSYNAEYVITTFFTKFANTSIFIEGSVRMRLIIDYLDEIRNSVFGFLFGVNTKELSSLTASFGGNIHNSFFMLHASFGILGLIFVIITSIWTVVALIKAKRSELAILILTLDFRSITDDIFPFSMGVIIPLFCVLTCLNKRTKPIHSLAVYSGCDESIYANG